jgi:hypothetical protein
MTYDDARHEVGQGIVSGRYNLIQGRRLRAAIRVLERYYIDLPRWSELAAVCDQPDWADRLLRLSNVVVLATPSARRTGGVTAVRLD